MIKKEQHNDEFHLFRIRNNNGEWIDEDNVVYLSHIEAIFYKMLAGKNGKSLSLQHGPSNSIWCYKHEYEEVIALNNPRPFFAPRKLKIKKHSINKTIMEKPLIYSGDKPFKRKARTHQSDFRENVLKVSFDPENRYGKYGAFLKPEDANKGLNFCDDFREEIKEKINDRFHSLTAIQHDGLYANMLRSEHIPWNMFVPMMHDYDATAKVFNDIIGTNEIDKVTNIRIEWAPKDKTLCLNDNTSFDTYIEYECKGKKCGIGIEVKYTEEGYPFGKKERREVMENDNSRYAQITKACGWFIPEIAQCLIKDTPLCKNKYRQIWRNHILGASMVNNHLTEKIEKFHSITIYPKGNPHFCEVLPQYEQFLTNKGRSTFGYITIEDLIDLIEKHFPKTVEYQNWIQYLKDRYPF